MDDLARDTELIEELVQFSGLTPTAIAKRAGLAVTTVTRPHKGKAETRLGRVVLEKLQSAFPDFPGWPEPIATSKLQDRQLSFRGEQPERDLQMVEIGEIDLRFGLGAAYMDQEIVESEVRMRSFPREWVRQITTSPPDQLYWAMGVGDSMEPKISQGDIILIDRSQQSPGFGDLYWAIAYGQTGMIKRLRPMPDGSVKILSDNQNVPPEIAYDGELHIFGRVVAVVKKI